MLTMEKFIEELMDMNLEQVEQRLSDMETEIRSANTMSDLEGMEEKLSALQERRSELKDLETRKQAALDLQNGVVEGKIVEERGKKVMEKTFELGTPEYRNAWLAQLQGKQIEERAAIAIADAGAVIPEELQNNIISKAKEYAPILNEITLLNVPGGVKFAVEGVTNAAEKHAENATITPASDTMIPVVLSAYEITKLIQISASVKNMSIASFEAWLVSNLAEAIAMKAENLVFNGSGSGEATGLVATATPVSGGITSANVYAAFGVLKSGYARNAKVAVNRNTFFTTVLTLQDKAKNDLVVRDGGEYVLLGAKVMFTDSLANGAMVVGDFKKYVANMAEGQNVKTQYDINTNSYKYLGVTEFDGKPAIEDAFVKIEA
jgi:HK97 family phage major capsid protein